MATRKWGPERLVNTTTAVFQGTPAIARLTGGNLVVAWHELTLSGTAIRGQILDATGAAVGAEFTLAESATLDLTNPAVTATADGGFFVTWTQDASPDNYVLGSVHAADGAKLRDQPVVFAFGMDDHAAVARLGGGTVAAWIDPEPQSIRYRVFDAAGVGTGLLDAIPPGSVGLSRPAVASSPDGSRAVIAAALSGPGLVDLLVVNAAGTPVASFVATSGAPGLEVGHATVAWLNNSQFVVAWQQMAANNNVSGSDIQARVVSYGTTGLPAFGPQFTVNATTLSGQITPSIAALPGGGFVVAWVDYSQSGGVDADIRLQAFSPDGARLGGEIVVNSDSGYIGDPAVAALADGRVAVTWRGPGEGSDILLQIVDPRQGIVTGGAGADVLRGHDSVADEINGRAGNDTLYGLRGDDALYGGDGDDLLDGGLGADDMFGGRGNDAYVLDQAGDTVTEMANEGLDTILTAAFGVDLALFAHVENATLTGGLALWAKGTGGANMLDGAQNSAANVLTGLGGNDTYTLGAGDTAVEAAGGGTDTVLSGAVSIDLGQPAFANIENATLTGTAALSATGSAGDNVLSGAFNTAANKLTGLGGNDTYEVGAGDTVVEAAGGGTDTVRSPSISLNLASYANTENATLLGTLALSATGTSGANVLDGAQNSAANTLTGLGGNDTYWVGAGDSVVEAAGGGYDLVQSALVSLDLATYSNAEWLVLRGALPLTAKGDNANNIIDGSLNTAANVLTGLGGNDTYVVGAGDTVVEAAGGGTDQVQAWAVSVNLAGFANVENAALSGALALNLTGTAGANVLTGNAGANAITGNGGGDTFTGLGGLDTMTGGVGADMFRFLAPADSVPGAGRDVIQAFSGPGGDRIDLTAIDANDLIPGDQGFAWRGTSAFTGGRGELRYDVSGPDVIVQGTITGAAVAFEIRVAGVGALAMGDFKL